MISEEKLAITYKFVHILHVYVYFTKWFIILGSYFVKQYMSHVAHFFISSFLFTG